MSLALVVGLLLASMPAFAQNGRPVAQPAFPDGCENGLRQSVPIAIGSATTTSLIAPVTGKAVFICGIWLNSVGGTSTLEYGTGATCGTGTQTLTGALAAATTVSWPVSNNTIFATPVSQRVCILSGTSTSATEGWLNYVQE